jgi:hypothetical protein
MSPPENWLTQKSKSYYYSWSVGQSVLEESTHLGLTTGSLLLSDICGFVDVGRLVVFSIYSLRTEHAKKTQFYCCLAPTAQKHLKWFLPSEFIGALTVAKQRAINIRPIDTQLQLLRVLTCLLSCCLANRWSNTLLYKYIYIERERERESHVSEVPWRIITGSGLDDWIYWRPLYNHL